MNDTITIKRDDLEVVITAALQIGEVISGDARKRLAPALMNMADERAVKPVASVADFTWYGGGGGGAGGSKMQGVEFDATDFEAWTSKLLPRRKRFSPDKDFEVAVEKDGRISVWRNDIGANFFSDTEEATKFLAAELGADLGNEVFFYGSPEHLDAAFGMSDNVETGSGIEASCPSLPAADGASQVETDAVEKEECKSLLDAHARQLCARIGFPYWLATGDMVGVSDRSARRSIELARERLNAMFDEAENQLKPLSERISHASKWRCR